MDYLCDQFSPPVVEEGVPDLGVSPPQIIEPRLTLSQAIAQGYPVAQPRPIIQQNNNYQIG